MRSPRARSISDALRVHDSAAPAHLDAEILSALGRLARAGTLDADSIPARLDRLKAAPVKRRPLDGLLDDAWSMRHNLCLADGLYVALASRRGASLLTSDERLARSITDIPVIVPSHDA